METIFKKMNESNPQQQQQQPFTTEYCAAELKAVEKKINRIDELELKDNLTEKEKKELQLLKGKLEELNADKTYWKERLAVAQRPDSEYIPERTVVHIKEKFPEALIDEFENKKERKEGSSIHASTVFQIRKTDPDYSIRSFFDQYVIATKEWNLQYSAVHQDCRDKSIVDYEKEFEEGGLHLCDIQSDSSATIYLDMTDTRGIKISFSGRADYLLSREKSKASRWKTVQCVIEVQSQEDEEACEYQMLVYLFLAMNRFGLKKLLGLLVFKDKRCRLFKADRDGDGWGNSLFYSNGVFEIWQAAKLIKDNL